MSYTNSRLLRLYNNKAPKPLMSLKTEDIQGAKPNRMTRTRADNAEEKYLYGSLFHKGALETIKPIRSLKNVDHFHRVMARNPEGMLKFDRIVAETSFQETRKRETNIQNSIKFSNTSKIDFKTYNSEYGNFNPNFEGQNKAYEAPPAKPQYNDNPKQQETETLFESQVIQEQNPVNQVNPVKKNVHFKSSVKDYQDYERYKQQTNGNSMASYDDQENRSRQVYGNNVVSQSQNFPNNVQTMNYNNNGQHHLQGNSRVNQSQNFNNNGQQPIYGSSGLNQSQNYEMPVDAKSCIMNARSRKSNDLIKDYMIRKEINVTRRPLIPEFGNKPYDGKEEKDIFLENFRQNEQMYRKGNNRSYKSGVSQDNPFAIKVPYDPAKRMENVHYVKDIFDKMEHAPVPKLPELKSVTNTAASPHTLHDSYYERSYQNEPSQAKKINMGMYKNPQSFLKKESAVRPFKNDQEFRLNSYKFY